MILLNICISDLPTESIRVGKNGKSYINLICDERREVSQYGETHTITLSQSKEEREDKVAKVYVGGGKEYIFENRQQQQSPQQHARAPEPQSNLAKYQAEIKGKEANEIDDLPF